MGTVPEHHSNTPLRCEKGTTWDEVESLSSEQLTAFQQLCYFSSTKQGKLQDQRKYGTEQQRLDLLFSLSEKEDRPVNKVCNLVSSDVELPLASVHLTL